MFEALSTAKGSNRERECSRAGGGDPACDVGRDSAQQEATHPRPPLAYHLDDRTVTRFRGDLGSLHRETCDPKICIEPALADVPSYHAGRFAEPIVSPGGGPIAFTAWPFDRPEDLLVISAKSTP